MTSGNPISASDSFDRDNKNKRAMEEIWKSVPLIDEKYQCSNLGRFRKLNKDPRVRKYRYFNLKPAKNGYITVNPTIEYRRLIHRIVAQLFIPNPENKPCVNHKDGNPSNNVYTNLEWCTYKENTIHSFVVLKRKSSNRIRLIDTKTMVTYESIKEASIKLDKKYKYLCEVIKHNDHLTTLRYAETYQDIL